MWEKFGRRAESLARRDPAGSFRPHVPLLIPSGTPLIHGNAYKLVTVLLLSDAISNHPEPPSGVTRSDRGGRTDDKASICTYDKVTTGPL